MAVYFDKQIQFPRRFSVTGGRVHHAVEWHKLHTILAVASKNEATDTDGSVNFYVDEGELVEEALIQRSVAVECLQWHPTSRILAIGWRSGEITIYNDHTNEYFEQSSLHRSPITVISWNKNGSRLITSDKSGLLAVWTIEATGHINPVPIHQHRLLSPVAHLKILHPLTEVSIKPGGSVLDTFSWQRKNATHMAETMKDPIACFFVTQEGAMHFMDHGGVCKERFRLSGPVHTLLLRADMELMAALTQDMSLFQYSVTYDGQTSQIMNAKLSTQNKASCLIWAAEDMLASCSLESVVRLWDFERSENYALDLPSGGEEIITCISFNSETGVLAGGTSAGGLVLWKWVGGEMDGSLREGPNRWEVLNMSAIAGPPAQLQWGSSRHLLAVNCTSAVQVLSEHVMNSHHNQLVSAVQVSPSELLVECHSTKLIHTVQTDMHVRGVYVTQENVAVWSGRKLAVYAFSQDKHQVRNTGSFLTDTSSALLHEHSVYTVEVGAINVRSFQGTVKQVLSFGEQNGVPVSLAVGGHYLVAVTDTGHIRVWDISRREAKAHCSKELYSPDEECVQVTSVQCNSNGTKISFLSQNSNSKYYHLTLWDINSDKLNIFDPVLILNPPGPQLDNYLALPQDLHEASVDEQLSLFNELMDREFVTVRWDSSDPRICVLEAVKRKGIRVQGKNCLYSKASVLLVSLFLTSKMKVLISEIVPMDSQYKGFLGVSLPSIYISQKGGQSNSSRVYPMPMRGFSGLENSEPSTIRAILDFVYHSTMGNMDEAFKAIKLIKNASVWRNMACMCVRTHRLDVALMCLGNMGNAKAAKAVREAMTIPETEARLAVLAVQLGMLEEAEELYIQSKRYDLLNKFYQACGKWKKAIEVAELNDRMHLKTTYYNYGKNAEAMGDITAAINCYEKSGTHKFEVPRMLLDDPLELENYIMKSKDKGILKWWAEYLESMGEWEQAIKYYEAAKDYHSLVRILCFNGQVERAMHLAEDSGSRAACYHLARRLSMDTEDHDVRKAIHFYTKAQCYTPALQLAKENELDHDLMRLALLSSLEDMIDAARYFEEKSETLDSAITLYHRGGEISKALELCFKHHRFEVLHQIAEDLSEDSSSEMTRRVADYFMENEQFDKAVELLVKSKQVDSALDLCLSHHIRLTEEMVETMTPVKREGETPPEAEKRVKVLEKLADCCAEQGSYHLATKKYTQAGNKMKAMKALLKSGDTEKIVFFAGVSRQKDIYIMAANYLQSLDWRNNTEIMKNIVSFYTKGRAMESLAGFYDACAQFDIDEYQNYAKAAGALDQALKCLAKAKTKDPPALEAKINFLKERVELVKRFAEARRVYENDPEECIKQCQGLLDEPSLDTAVRVGDVYGLMIEHYGQAGSYQQAYALMEEMRQRMPTVNLAYYVDIRTIETIHSGLGIPLGRGVGGGVRCEASEESEDESVGEEVEEGL